ncbi:WYL domain-containing protein [Streptomyces sp. NPDC057486]|uniref:WYL domain-containing protein n=1 Tax=Streptomyces sp. NPDC057486 TaxID=3346145 RepID=UPI0036854A16
MWWASPRTRHGHPRGGRARPLWRLPTGPRLPDAAPGARQRRGPRRRPRTPRGRTARDGYDRAGRRGRPGQDRTGASARPAGTARRHAGDPLLHRQRCERTGTRERRPTCPGASLARQTTVGIKYQSWRQDQTERDNDPYGVVFHTGRWYLVGHDHLRDDLRTFRIDRIASVHSRTQTFTTPDGFDLVAHLTSTLAQGPYRWPVEVTIHGGSSYRQCGGRDGSCRLVVANPYLTPKSRRCRSA